MSDFLSALARHEFMQASLLVGLLASIACGVVGSYVVARRITYIAGGIAHCVLGGMGAAHYLRAAQDWTWLSPIHGAFAASIIAAIIIGFVSLRAKQREDTVISALWAIGMATGVLFMHATKGYHDDLISYLFGNIVLVAREDVYLLVALDIVVVGVALVFYNQLQAVCFDEEFARLRGLNVEFYYILLLCLTALTVVTLVSAVGVIMVIALLTLPVAIAACFCRTLWQMMLVAALLSMVCTSGGFAVSYAPNLPPGAVMILFAGAVYLLVIPATAVYHRLRRRRPA